MSFSDLHSGPKAGGGRASKQQPKQRRDDDSIFEKQIKANIQEMQDSLRKAGEQLDHLQKNILSRRAAESLDKFLDHSRELSHSTQRLFSEWTVHLAGEPSERYRKRFSSEKLQKAFEEEVSNLKDIARRAVVAQQEAMGRQTFECRPMCDDQGSSGCGDDVEQGLLDDSDCATSSRLSSMQEDLTIRNRIAQEREEGIRRIQGQVSEVNQIFRDLASIVQDQGNQFESIENQAESSASNTKQAVTELKKAVARQRGSRERLCCMLAAAILVLCFVILPHMNMLEFNYHFVHSSSASVDAAKRLHVGST